MGIQHEDHLLASAQAVYICVLSEQAPPYSVDI